MKVGIKFGPNQFPGVLEKSRAKYAEIYFRLDQKDQYKKIYQYLNANGIKFGIHFWAIIKGKYCPNLAYSGGGIAEETAELIKQTIDIASQAGAFYVNFHPESLRAVELDLDKQEFKTSPLPPITEQEAFDSLLYYLKILKEYASERNVEIYTETVPYYDPSHFREGEKEDGREKIVDKRGMSTKSLIKLGKKGFNLCFDIAHAGNQYPNETREMIFQKIYQEAREIAPYTKLIHVSTTVPPLNGTDSHNGILEDDFKQDAFPDREQLLKILAAFKKYPNILCIPEPQIDKMVENYFELKKILS